MLNEEISGKYLQRADFLSQIEFLELKELQIKQEQSEESRFYFEEQSLRKQIAVCVNEQILQRAKFIDLNNEISQLENQKNIIINKMKTLELACDFKQKEKIKMFYNVGETRKNLEKNLNFYLNSIEAQGLYLIIKKTSELLFENLDDLKFNDILNLLNSNKFLEDLKRFFKEKQVEEEIQAFIVENVQKYYEILKNYSYFRNFFEVFFIVIIFFHLDLHKNKEIEVLIQQSQEYENEIDFLMKSLEQKKMMRDDARHDMQENEKTLANLQNILKEKQSLFDCFIMSLSKNIYNNELAQKHENFLALQKIYGSRVQKI